jgi:peptidoglycan/LPS O-acetylase OafA/YrhL
MNLGLCICLSLLVVGSWGFADMALDILGRLARDSGISEGCKNRALKMLNNFAGDAELMSFVVNSGKGINDLGDYKGCNDKKNSTYIALQVNNLPLVVMIGLCVPKECGEKDFEGLRAPIASALNSILISNGTSPISKPVTPEDVDFMNPKERRANMELYGWPFILLMTIIILLVLVCVAAVIYRGLHVADIKEDGYLDPEKHGGWSGVLSCFDFAGNFLELFNSKLARENPDLQVMNGCRFGCMLWIILGHTFYYARFSPITNHNSILDFMKKFWNSYLTNAPFSVDVFFFMSGFLAFYLVITEVNRCKGCPSLWRIYVHRYLRLAPAFLTVVFSYSWVLPTLVEGPSMQHLVDSVNRSCRKYSYADVIFMHNFLQPEHECAGWVWYLSNDMEYFLMVPIIALVYYRSKALGGALLALIGIGCMITTMALCVHFKLSASLMKFGASYFDYYYDKIYARIFTYLLGIFAAMIYLAYKEKQDNWMYRFSLALRKYAPLRWVLYLASAVAIFWLIHAMYWLNNYPNDWTVAQDTIYLAWHKAAFIFCLFFILYPAMIGRASVVRAVLGHRFFAPLGKLTFVVYVFHPMMIEYHGYNEIKGDFFDYDKYLLKFYGYSVLAYCVSLVFTPILTTPFRNLTKKHLKAWGHPVYAASSTEADDGPKSLPSNERHDPEETAPINATILQRSGQDQI